MCFCTFENVKKCVFGWNRMIISQRLKSTFFWDFSSLHWLLRGCSVRKISKNVNFILWGKLYCTGKMRPILWKSHIVVCDLYPKENKIRGFFFTFYTWAWRDAWPIWFGDILFLDYYRYIVEVPRLPLQILQIWWNQTQKPKSHFDPHAIDEIGHKRFESLRGQKRRLLSSTK